MTVVERRKTRCSCVRTYKRKLAERFPKLATVVDFADIIGDEHFRNCWRFEIRRTRFVGLVTVAVENDATNGRNTNDRDNRKPEKRRFIVSILKIVWGN